MRYIFRDYGKNARTCFETLANSPWGLAKVWEAYCRFLILTSQGAGKAPPALDGQRRAVDTFQTLMVPSGVGRAGPWCLHPHLLSPQTSLVIHWPSLFRCIPHLQATFPPALFLIGMLLPLVARKSPAMAQIMRRGLLDQVETVMLSEIGNQKKLVAGFESLEPEEGLTKSAYPFEHEFYQKACGTLADDGAFIRACRNSFNATFGSWASVGDNEYLCRQYRQKGFVGTEDGVPYHLDCSVMRPGLIADPKFAQTPEVALKSKQLQQHYGKQFRPLSQGLVGEILFANDIAKPIPGEDGDVWRSRVIKLGVTHYERDRLKYLAMDWGRWFEYRYITTGTFFRQDLLSAGLGEQGYLLNIAMRREALSRKIRSLYAPGAYTILTAPGRLPLPDALVKAWGTAAYLVDVIPLEILEIKSYREVSREFGWKGSVRRMTAALKGVKNKRAHRPLYFSLRLLLPGAEVMLSTMKGFHLGRTVYFQVPGFFGKEMFIPRTGPAHRLASKRLPRGILVQDNVYSFTARYLMQNIHLFPNLNKEHLEQLESFSRNTRVDIVRYVKEHSHSVPVGRPSKFSDKQDDAIVTYYRPKMNEEARTALWTACHGLTAPEVARRAKLLRDKLIWEDGITECSDLPHQRRTKGLLGEIRNAVKAKGKKEVK